MQPYYQDELVTLYHADLRELAVDLSAVTCVVTDPPYEETEFAWDRWPQGWPAWLLQACPALDSLWCFGSLRMFSAFAAEFAGWHLAQDIVWEKPNGSSFHTDRFRRVHELAAQFYPRRRAWGEVFKAPIVRTVEESRRRSPIHRSSTPAHHHGRRAECTYEYSGQRLARSVMYAPAVRQGVEHGTPKPLPILRDLIAYSLRPGGVLLDPMCGSGSTLVAAKELARPSIGIDGDINAVREAARRCQQSQLSLPLPI